MKNSLSKLPVFRLAAVLCLLAAATSCSDDDDIGGVDTPVVPKVSITVPSAALVLQDTLQLKVQDTLRLSATVEFENSASEQVSWSSDDTSIAVVDTTGLVRGIAEGTTTLTATAQEDPRATATLLLKVSGPNTILALSIADLEAVKPVITDTEVRFEIDFNTEEGRTLDVANLTTIVTHNGTTISAPQSTSSNTTPFTATLTENFTGGPIAYTVSGEDGEARTYQVSVQTKPGTEFITTWNEAAITVPTSSGFTYNYNVDTNNDGFIDQTGITGDALVEFSGAERTLRISGQFPAIIFLSSFEGDKIESLEQWGTVKWEFMRGAFAGCDSLQVPAKDVPDLSRVTDMSGMFLGASEANPDVSRWDISNVNNMFSMFQDATSADPDLSQWNISRIRPSTGMSSTFEDSGISRENYEKALIRFAEHAEEGNDLTLPGGIDLREVPVTFCSEAAADAKAILEANGWTGIGDRGTDCDL